MSFFGFSGSSLHSSSNASSSSMDFWFQNERMNFGYGWATPFALLVILIFHFSKRLFSSSSPKRDLVSSSPASTATDIGSSNYRYLLFFFSLVPLCLRSKLNLFCFCFFFFPLHGNALFSFFFIFVINLRFVLDWGLV
jgi:hypothetical protein